MDFGQALATVLVSIATSVLGSVLVIGILEHKLEISIRLLHFSLRFLSINEREDFRLEALGNLRRLQDRPLKCIAHSVGFLPAVFRIERRSRRRARESDVRAVVREVTESQAAESVHVGEWT